MTNLGPGVGNYGGGEVTGNMALGLHPKARAAIIVALEKGLPHITVNNEMFVERFTAFLASYEADQVLPTTGKLHERIIDYIDDSPLVEFVTDFLGRELSDRGIYEAEPAKRKLVEIEEYSDVKLTANRIIDAFESLPWRYTLTAPLPFTLLPEAVFENASLALGQTGKIVKPDLLMNDEFPITHVNPNVQKRGSTGGILGMLNPPTEWKSDSCYIQEESEGFVGIYGDTNSMERVDRKLESFLGLGLSTKLFSFVYKYENPEIKFKWTLHQRNNDQWELASKIPANKDTLEVMRHMKSFAFEENYPEKDRLPWLRKMLVQADKIFKAENCNTLLLSSKWFFDSFKGTDTTLKYIRMMTCLEILLGEKADISKISLGELLSNRLAYLIGKSHNDRAEILSEFKKIYGTRSSILHHGKHRLTGDERGQILKLRKFCERAIEAEVRLILA